MTHPAEQIPSKIIVTKIILKPLQVQSKKHRQTPIRVTNVTFDPRMVRIKRKEEPTLRERGFVAMDHSLSTWLGNYKGYPVQIYFPPEYPAVPLRWYWQKIPRRFVNIINSNELCIEALLSKEAWTPDITCETVFEAMDSHSYWRGR